MPMMMPAAPAPAPAQQMQVTLQMQAELMPCGYGCAAQCAPMCNYGKHYFYTNNHNYFHLKPWLIQYLQLNLFCFNVCVLGANSL